MSYIDLKSEEIFVISDEPIMAHYWFNDKTSADRFEVLLRENGIVMGTYSFDYPDEFGYKPATVIMRKDVFDRNSTPNRSFEIEYEIEVPFWRHYTIMEELEKKAGVSSYTSDLGYIEWSLHE